MIETERLLLRRPLREDLEPIHAMRSDPEVIRFVGGRPLSREEAWHRLARSAGNWALLGYGFFAVVEKASGRLVGESGLMQACRGLGDAFDPFPEAGWVFAREAQGKGYATEAALAAHGWFAGAVGASRTVCIIAPETTLRCASPQNWGTRPSAQPAITTRR